MVHLPALNTPQFDVVKTRLPRSPKPVPPIYEPEVAAEAIVWAIERTPRDLYVGFSSVGAVTANKVAPGLVDRYLARTRYDAQQTTTLVDLTRPDNLWAPVPGDQGAHGRFDAMARPRSVQSWIRTHRPVVAAAAGALAAVVARKRLS
jgi:hypothetical protein